MEIGNVSMTNIGRTTALRTPNIRAVIIAGYTPVIVIPGINSLISKSARATNNILEISRISMSKV